MNADLNELSEMIAQGTLQCFELMIKKTEKLGELIQKESLLSDIDKAISEFMRQPFLLTYTNPTDLFARLL